MYQIRSTLRPWVSGVYRRSSRFRSRKPGSSGLGLRELWLREASGVSLLPRTSRTYIFACPIGVPGFVVPVAVHKAKFENEGPG